jgi:hypothetical protein
VIHLSSTAGAPPSTALETLPLPRWPTSGSREVAMEAEPTSSQGVAAELAVSSAIAPGEVAPLA